MKYLLILSGLVSLTIALAAALAPQTKEWAEYKKTAVTSCFSDGEIEACRRTWLEKGESPLKDIDVCWLYPRPNLDGASFAISCEKYDKIRNSLDD